MRTLVCVAAIALLAGCASSPNSAVSPGPDTGSPASKTTQTPEEIDFSDPAACLIGTWKQDMVALSSAMGMKFYGGSYVRFDHKGMFFVWDEDSTFEHSITGVKTQVVGNGDGFGDYTITDEAIHWANYVVLTHNIKVYEDGQLVSDENVEASDSYSSPSTFTCSAEKLEYAIGGELMLDRVYERIAGKTDQY